MNSNFEKYVSETILEDAITINVKGVEYKVSPPSTATIIELGKYLATLEEIKVNKKKDVISQVLSVAHKCDFLGDIAAILILGKKKLFTTEKVVTRRLFGYPIAWKEERVNHQKALASMLMEECDSETLYNIIVEVLKSLKVDFFLAIITFLQEAQLNVIAPTKQ